MRPRSGLGCLELSPEGISGSGELGPKGGLELGGEGQRRGSVGGSTGVFHHWVASQATGGSLALSAQPAPFPSPSLLPSPPP